VCFNACKIAGYSQGDALGWDCSRRWRTVFVALGLMMLDGEQFGVESWRILAAS